MLLICSHLILEPNCLGNCSSLWQLNSLPVYGDSCLTEVSVVQLKKRKKFLVFSLIWAKSQETHSWHLRVSSEWLKTTNRNNCFWSQALKPGVLTVGKMSVFKTIAFLLWQEMRLITAKSIRVVVCELQGFDTTIQFSKEESSWHSGSHIKVHTWNQADKTIRNRRSHTLNLNLKKNKKTFVSCYEGSRGFLSLYWAEGLRDPQMAGWTAGHSHGNKEIRMIQSQTHALSHPWCLWLPQAHRHTKTVQLENTIQ